MFKEKKMRQIIEQHLRNVDSLLQKAKENNLVYAEIYFASQKVALEYLIRDLDKL